MSQLRSSRTSKASRSISIFPLPVLDAPHMPASRSRRVASRYRDNVNIIQLANNTIQSLNHLSQSLSSSFVSSSSFSSRSFNSQARQFISSTQFRLQSHIHQCATRFYRRRGHSTGLQCVDSSIHSSSTSHLHDPSFAYSSLKHSAIRVIASRVSLPSSVGSVSLIDFLPPPLRLMYTNPSLLFRPPLDRPSTPRFVFYTNQREYVDLIRRMHAINMVSFTLAPLCVNGMFAVEKDVDKDRLIIDARPANGVFIDPPTVELPTPDLICNLSLHDKRPLYVAKVDLDNFYHRLSLPEWMRVYFALPPVRARDVDMGSHYGDDTLIYPCCNTLPMGWSHSVFLAQSVHEHMLNTLTRLHLHDRITHHNDLHVTRTRHQVYIDDLILYGHDKDAIQSLQDEYMHAAVSCGFVIKMVKVVRPCCDGVECVGMEVNGVNGEIGVSVPKLIQLCNDTHTLIHTGACTGIQLSQLVGRWTWASLANRMALSIFSAVYRFIERAGGKRFILWASVKRELNTIIHIAPLLFTSLRHRWFDRVVATDASDIGLGVTASSSTHLSSSSFLDLINTCVCTPHHVIISSAWKQYEHINVLEVRAINTAVRWVLSFPHSLSCHLIMLCDSLVAVQAIVKGRSSSPHLLPRLRTLASLLLASGLRLHMVWVPSSLNPADAPSRLK